MNKSVFILLTTLLLSLACRAEEPPAALARNASLTAEEATEYAAFLREQWRDSVRTALETAFREKVFTHGDYRMKVDWKTFGTAPAEGRALYISLHGGGGAPPRLNDQQWENQLRLYQPAEGIYLCPRAITDTWDLHFRPESDGFYEDIIRMAVAYLDVNPDKVYLMGYSAGGDGVWRLAPRMADHWAAASMMAGHPGDVALEGLRNLPFMIWCGELDAAYDRNLECAKRIEQMDALQAADPEGYVHEGHIVAGKEHWMELEDAAAVPWMARFRRNPYPDKVVWVQGDVLKPAFYWLGVPVDRAEKGSRIEARIDGNTVEILSSDYPSASIYLNDAMMDLGKPVKVVYKGKTLFNGKVVRRPSVLRETLRMRGDFAYMFPVRLDVKLP